jgi:hypothetical protein
MLFLALNSYLVRVKPDTKMKTTLLLLFSLLFPPSFSQKPVNDGMVIIPGGEFLMGSWHSGAMCKKVFYRKGLIVSWCDFAVGFRCVKDMEETQ